jgi:hypothetical protein
VVRILPEFLHVGPDQHLPELNEIAVVLIVDLDHAPWVRPAANFTAIWGLHDLVRTDNSKRNLAGDFLSFCNSFLILVIVNRRLENVDIMEGDVGKDLGEVWALSVRTRLVTDSTYPGLEIRDFFVCHCVGLGDNGYQVDFSVKPTHELNVDLLQAIHDVRVMLVEPDDWTYE